jgi:hypothetical protein
MGYTTVEDLADESFEWLVGGLDDQVGVSAEEVDRRR